MFRTGRRLLFSLLALLLFAATASAQESASGRWTITVNSPDMGAIAMEFDLQQQGAVVTGTVSMSIPEIEGTHLTDGLFEDGVLSFVLHVGVQGQWLAVEVEAEVDGDAMVGEAYMAEMGVATPFTGKRAAGH